MDIEILDVKEQVLEENDRIAASTRAELLRNKVFLINLMGSPGAGKTSVLLQLIKRLGESCRIGVMEADVDSDVDARTVSEAGAKVVQLHTGGLCHMDAAMTAQGLEVLGALPTQNLPCKQGRGTGLKAGGGVRSDLDLVFLENVGNLVCPAEFDVGADLRMMILSVPEGDDKPLKYPLMFTVSDVMLVNKIDTAPIFDFDLEAASARARSLNPHIEIFPISAKTGEGFDDLTDWLKRRLDRTVGGGALKPPKGMACAFEHSSPAQTAGPHRGPGADRACAPSQHIEQRNGPSRTPAPTTEKSVGADAHIGPAFPEGGPAE